MLSTAITKNIPVYEASYWVEQLLTGIKLLPLLPDEDNLVVLIFGGSLVLDFRNWWASRYTTYYDWLFDCWPLTPLRPSWKCSRRNLTIILFHKRTCEHNAQFNVLWQQSRVLYLFLFCFVFRFQFSTPCNSMSTSKSGVKIRIAPSLAAWRCSSLSTICKEKYVDWLGKTSWEPSCKLETLKWLHFVGL